MNDTIAKPLLLLELGRIFDIYKDEAGYHETIECFRNFKDVGEYVVINKRHKLLR